MISQIVGKIIDKSENSLMIETESGIVFEVLCPDSTIKSMNTQIGNVRIYTHFHVREDQMTLFGFSSKEELTLFKYLISVPDIGPKKAISIMSGESFEAIINAIVSSDIRFLSSIPGIGKKTAEKITIELKDKLLRLTESNKITPAGIDKTMQDELYSALINLGYKPNQAEKAIANLKNIDNNDFNSLFKEALNIIKSI